MWKSKKVIIMALLAIAVLAGSMAGIAFAQDDGNGDESQCVDRYESLMDRVCGIYQENTGVSIDPEQLKDAFAQAQSQIAEEALESHLQSLVDQGTITQEEADEYLEWWQARPDTLPLGPGGRGFGPGGFGGRMHCGPEW
jgi:hypothetical protein